MKNDSRIWVAGHMGLVGSAIVDALRGKGYRNLILKSKEEMDLCNQQVTFEFVEKEKPEYVFLAAAKVGGIMSNSTYRADYIYENTLIQSNVIGTSWKYGVKKLLFLGSTCIYPKNAPQPMKEEHLLSSPLEYTNEPYAIAKINGLKMCESFNKQYSTDFISVMPTNLYGSNDNFDLDNSHVLPALIRKIHLARCLEEGQWDLLAADIRKHSSREKFSGSQKEISEFLEKGGIKLNSGKVTVELWGSGNPQREFMHSSDMAAACLFLMENVSVSDIIKIHQKQNPHLANPPHFLNIGTGEEITIKDLAYLIKKITDYKGEITFDISKPDGPIRKATDSTILRSLGFQHKTNLITGLTAVCLDYEMNR